MNLKSLKKIQAHLQRAPQSVQLVAVTKYADAQTTQELIDSGVDAIAENRVEVAEEKFPHLSKVEKHFVGQIQSKKIRRIISLFDVIQSVGFNDHLLKIDQIAQEMNKPVQIFLQFNISNESQKSGYSPYELGSIKETLGQIQFIQVVGLMGMASQIDEEGIRAQFKSLRQLRDELSKEFPSIRELSMGMSRDYQLAIEEGATVVRIGRGIMSD